MLQERVEQFIKKPKKALFILAAPILVAMLVQTMYNLVDTAFVGRLGAESIAALTFAFPVFFILMAVMSGIGVGMASRISRFLGEKKHAKAENTAVHGLILSVVVAAVIFFIGIFTLEPLFSVFGATDTVLKLSINYMSIILIGVFFMFPSYVMNGIFAAQGDTKTPMKVQVSALVLNMILDPIFIYVLGYGVKGAAIATTIAFFFGFLLYLYFLRRKSQLKVNIHAFKFSFPLLKDIFTVGAPASIMMLILSIYMMFLNRFMSHFGTDYIAAFGIVSKLESVAIMPIVAFAMASMTLVGMLYGAKKVHILKDTCTYGIKIVVLITIGIGIIFFAFSAFFMRIFTPDALITELGSKYLRIDVFTFPLMAVGIMVSRIMQGMGMGMPSMMIQVVRIFVVAVPLSYIFVFILGYGYLSIAVATVLGGIASSIVASVWLRNRINKLNQENSA